MNDFYLEVTFRHGRPLAGYYYLPRRPGQKSYRCRELGPGLIVDYTRSGTPIGIEIVDPALVTVAAMNRVLRQLKQPALTRKDLVPMKVA